MAKRQRVDDSLESSFESVVAADAGTEPETEARSESQTKREMKCGAESPAILATKVKQKPTDLPPIDLDRYDNIDTYSWASCKSHPIRNIWKRVPKEVMCVIIYHLDIRSYQRMAGSCCQWRVACQHQLPSSIKYPFEPLLPWLQSFDDGTTEECDADIRITTNQTDEGDRMRQFSRQLGTISYLESLHIRASHADWRIAQALLSHVQSCSAVHYTLDMKCVDCDDLSEVTCDCQRCEEGVESLISGTTNHNESQWYINSLPAEVSTITMTASGDVFTGNHKHMHVLMTLNHTSRQRLKLIILEGLMVFATGTDLRDYSNLRALKMTVFSGSIRDRKVPWSHLIVPTLSYLVLNMSNLCEYNLGHTCRLTAICLNRTGIYEAICALFDPSPSANVASGSESTTSVSTATTSTKEKKKKEKSNLKVLAITFTNQESKSIGHAIYREQFNTLIKHERCVRALFIGGHAASIRDMMDTETQARSDVATFVQLNEITEQWAFINLITEDDGDVSAFVLLLQFDSV